MKKIRMYNMGFGDCFCLRDRKSSLLVDFGTSNRRIGNTDTEEVYEKVISDLTTIPRKSLLLSHFHPDHLSGLIYMLRRHRQSDSFSVIYLPDLFSSPELTRLLTLLILADLSSYLPGRYVSLTALLEVLYNNSCTIHLLKRGDLFESRYQVLWPDPDRVLSEYDNLIREIPEVCRPGWKALYELTERMRQLILTCTDEARVRKEEGQQLQSAVKESGSEAEEPETEKNPVGELLGRFALLRRSEEVQLLLTFLKSQQEQLGKLRYKISLAFHNAAESELSVLFTGDILPEDLQAVAENYDHKLPLYDHYWSIKVSHHGTASHYFDFHPFTPDNLLISNGIYYSNSRRQERESRICGLYAGLFYIPDTTMYCSSCSACEGHKTGCTCREYEILEPTFYKDI